MTKLMRGSECEERHWLILKVKDQNDEFGQSQGPFVTKSKNILKMSKP